MSRSPLQIARTTLTQAERALPTYACKNSRKDFTVPQLATLVVLKQVFQLDYRGLVSWLADWSDLRTALRLAKVPHFTTLQKAACGFKSVSGFKDGNERVLDDHFVSSSINFRNHHEEVVSEVEEHTRVKGIQANAKESEHDTDQEKVGEAGNGKMDDHEEKGAHENRVGGIEQAAQAPQNDASERQLFEDRWLNTVGRKDQGPAIARLQEASRILKLFNAKEAMKSFDHQGSRYKSDDGQADRCNVPPKTGSSTQGRLHISSR